MAYRSEYERYIASHRWRSRRDAFFLSAGRVCFGCRSESDLQVHHLSYVRMGSELDSDLMVLCQRCHSFVHDYHRRVGGLLASATYSAVKVLQRPKRRVKRSKQGEVVSVRLVGKVDPLGFASRPAASVNNGDGRISPVPSKTIKEYEQQVRARIKKERANAAPKVLTGLTIEQRRQRAKVRRQSGF